MLDNPAVLTVDMHHGHLDPEIAELPVPPDVADRVIGHTERLLEAARDVGVPVLHVTTAFRSADEILANPKWSETDTDEGHTREGVSTFNVQGTEGEAGIEIMPTLADESDTYILPKKRYSPFRGTDLDFVLDRLGVGQLFLAGVNTNTCIQCTSFEATNRDYAVYVVEECVDSMDGEEFHEWGLRNIDRALGTVVSIGEATAMLESDRAAAA